MDGSVFSILGLQSPADERLRWKIKDIFGHVAHKCQVMRHWFVVILLKKRQDIYEPIEFLSQT